MSEYERGREYHQQSLEILRDIGDKKGEAKTLMNIGNLERAQGSNEKAKESLEQALNIAEEIGAKQIRVSALAGLGLLQASITELQDKAEETLQYTRQISEELGTKSAIGMSKYGLGVLAHERKEFATARRHLSESYDIADEIASHQLKCSVAARLALVCMDAGDYTEAVEWYESTADMAATIGYLLLELISLSYAVKLGAELGHTNQAVGHCERALELFEKNEDLLSGVSDLDEDWFNSYLDQLCGKKE